MIDENWQPGEHRLAIELQPLTPADNRSARSRSGSSLSRSGARWKKSTGCGPSITRVSSPKTFLQPLPTASTMHTSCSSASRPGLFGALCDRDGRSTGGIRHRHLAQEGQTFEAGIAQAMTAVLASPAISLSRGEPVPGSSESFPLVDEYALASRLSYFLWSSMPDQELYRLAAANKLRENLHTQVTRMLADGRSEEFVRHFVGQWLQARDIESVQINAFAVISRDQTPDPEVEKRRARFRELSRKSSETLTDLEKKELEQIRGSFGSSFRRFREFELNGELRRTMRRETEMLFGYVLRNDRNVLELIDSSYTFLNERLAGIRDQRCSGRRNA